MTARWRMAIFLFGAIPMGFLAAKLWPIGNWWTMAIVLFAYQLVMQPWAMTGEWLWQMKRRKP